MLWNYYRTKCGKDVCPITVATIFLFILVLYKGKCTLAPGFLLNWFNQLIFSVIAIHTHRYMLSRDDLQFEEIKEILTVISPKKANIQAANVLVKELPQPPWKTGIGRVWTWHCYLYSFNRQLMQLGNYCTLGVRIAIEVLLLWLHIYIISETISPVLNRYFRFPLNIVLSLNLCITFLTCTHIQPMLLFPLVTQRKRTGVLTGFWEKA